MFQFLNISCTSWFCTGECRLENVRTLCVACHADVTAAQCVERSITRANAKRELKAAMKKSNDPQKRDTIDSKQEAFLLEITFIMISFLSGSCVSHYISLFRGSGTSTSRRLG